MSRAELIRAVKRYAGEHQGALNVERFCRAQKVSTRTVYLAFERGWRGLLGAAGLGERLGRIARLSEPELFRDLDRVARELGRVPTRIEMGRCGRYSAATLYRRIGTWKEVVAAYEQWKSERSDPGAWPVQEHGPRHGGEESASGGTRGTATATATVEGAAAPEHRLAEEPQVDGTGGEHGQAQGPVIDRPLSLVGAPLALPGLVFAPVNEAGVVHLFGLLWPRHGIAVEQMGTAYPDCRALRAEAGGKWRRIAVEFELKASNFRAHGHDPARCDLIVCWEDDWKDSPVEVMELRSKIGKGAA